MLKVDPELKELVQRQLAERSIRPSGGAPRPVTTVRSRALHDLQFRATVEGHSFISDERDEAGGHDAGPAPLRYFLAGVMMCHQVWCVKSAALLDVKLERLECEISGYLEPPTEGGAPAEGRGFARVAYTVTIDSPSSGDDIRALVDQATRRCAAFVTLQRGTRIDLTLIHNGASLDERVYGGQR